MRYQGYLGYAAEPTRLVREAPLQRSYVLLKQLRGVPVCGSVAIPWWISRRPPPDEPIYILQNNSRGVEISNQPYKRVCVYIRTNQKREEKRKETRKIQSVQKWGEVFTELKFMYNQCLRIYV